MNNTCQKAVKMMNRAEMRRQKRAEAKADKVYHLTKAQLDRIVAEATERAIKQLLMDRVEKNFVVMMMLPCVALRDVFGFGKERITRFMDNVVTKYECMIDDHDHKRRDSYDFDTFVDLLKEETGFDVAEYLQQRKVLQKANNGSE